MKLPKLSACITAIAATAAISLGASDAMAWIGLDGPPYPFWGSVPVKYYVNAATFPAEIKATAQQRLVDGFTSWGTPDCTYFDTQLMGDLPNGTYSVNDGKNVLLWINKPDPWPFELGDVNSVIGVTLPVWSGDAQGNQIIYDADIVFNNVGFCWYDSKVSGPNCAGGTPVDTQSIATHEQGHFLGLGHTDVSGATMEPFYGGGDAIASIEQDDIAGVCGLYPVGGATVSAAAGGVQCDPCRLSAANNECVTQTKACTGACLGIYNCIEACPTSDPNAYDACATACSQQFPDGVTPYLNYANCICNICAEACGPACGGGPGGTGAGGGGGQASGAWNSDDPGPVINDSGGCGCAVYGSDARLGALGTLVVAAAAIARRRRRR